MAVWLVLCWLWMCICMSQYELIWYGNMVNEQLWTRINPLWVDFNIRSDGRCFDGKCTRAKGNTSFHRFTNISGLYSSIQLQFSVTTRDLEDNEFCQVFYGYDILDQGTLLHNYANNDTVIMKRFPNETFNLSTPRTARRIWILFTVQLNTNPTSDTCRHRRKKFFFLYMTFAC
eukprot:103645_1